MIIHLTEKAPSALTGLAQGVDNIRNERNKSKYGVIIRRIGCRDNIRSRGFCCKNIAQHPAGGGYIDAWLPGGTLRGGFINLPKLHASKFSDTKLVDGFTNKFCHYQPD